MKNANLIGSLLSLAAIGTWMTADARETPVRREALPAAVSAALESLELVYAANGSRLSAKKVAGKF